MSHHAHRRFHWGLLLIAGLAGMTAVLLPHLVSGGGVDGVEGYTVFPLYATAWDNLQPLNTMLIAGGLGLILGVMYFRHWFTIGAGFLTLHSLWILLDGIFGQRSLNLFPFVVLFGMLLLAFPGLAGAFLGSRVRRTLFPLGRSHRS